MVESKLRLPVRYAVHATEGRYKAQVVDGDDYLLRVLSNSMMDSLRR